MGTETQPASTTDERVAELLAGADEWHASLPRLYPDNPDGLAGEYPINPGLVQNLAHALRDRQIVLDQNRAYFAELERLRAQQGVVLWEGATTDHGAASPATSSIADRYDSVPVLRCPAGTRVRVVTVPEEANDA